MTEPTTPRTSSRETDAPAEREWSAPKVIEYGPLAKLTRGTSGMNTESGGMCMGCK